MIMKVTNNDTQDLPSRRIVGNANRILSVLGASSCQKSNTCNSPNAKSCYCGIFGSRDRLRERELSRNDSIGETAMLKHIPASRASTLHLRHYWVDREKEHDAKRQSRKSRDHDAGSWQQAFDPEPGPLNTTDLFRTRLLMLRHRFRVTRLWGTSERNVVPGKHLR